MEFYGHPPSSYNLLAQIGLSYGCLVDGTACTPQLISTAVAGWPANNPLLLTFPEPFQRPRIPPAAWRGGKKRKRKKGEKNKKNTTSSERGANWL